MSIIRAFNDHFEEFVSDVERVFPDDTDIATAHTALITLRKTNPKLILVTFRDWVARPYKDQIEAGDVSFFIQKDYGNDIEDFGYEDSGIILSKIDTLREPISRMNKADQDKVVSYLQNLRKLSELYV